MKTISASRVAAMLGMDPRCSPLALYHELRGETPPLEDNEVLKEGRYFEDAIARIAAEKFGFQIDIDAPLELQSGVIIGHPDRFFVVEEDGVLVTGVLEIKNTLYGEIGVGGWGDPGTDQVPKGYWIQDQCYSWLAKQNAKKFGYRVADYALLAARLKGGVQLYKIPLDLEVINKVIAASIEFLDRVRDGNPPDAQDEADSRNRWLVTPKQEVEVDSGTMAKLRTLVELRKQKKAIEDAISEVQFYLLELARDAEALVYVTPDGVRKTVGHLSANRSFDEAACIADHPEVLQRFAKLDVAALRKADKTLHEMYMRRAETAIDQKRTIRVREEDLE